MEFNTKKCSYKEHKEINAISYCQECNINMCNKCSNHHQQLFENHHMYDLTKNVSEIFINICPEKNHNNKLQYYCEDHNKLCCANCITKIEGEGNGQHKDCNICFIKDIKEEKKNKLNENIKYLEDLSNKLDDSIKELKLMFEKLNANKEELKLKIQKIFTNIRKILNAREDELLFEVENKYNNLFFNEEIIKETEIIPNKVKTSLEKGKLIKNNEWDDIDKLNSTINDCINIENNINNINIIYANINKLKLNNNINIHFCSKEKSLEESIKSFGKIYNIFDLDSLILTNIDDINTFYGLISTEIKIINILNLELLYRYTKDGIGFKNVVDKINNKSNLIFLFFTGNQKIFGAFINSKLENIGQDRCFKDEKAFVFNLNKNKIYKILIPEKAIRFFEGYPILIGNDQNANGFWINNNNIQDSGLLIKPKIYDFQESKELTEGLDKLTELEIFEIIYK